MKVSVGRTLILLGVWLLSTSFFLGSQEVRASADPLAGYVFSTDLSADTEIVGAFLVGGTMQTNAFPTGAILGPYSMSSQSITSSFRGHIGAGANALATLIGASFNFDNYHFQNTSLTHVQERHIDFNKVSLPNLANQNMVTSIITADISSSVCQLSNVHVAVALNGVPQTTSHSAAPASSAPAPLAPASPSVLVTSTPTATPTATPTPAVAPCSTDQGGFTEEEIPTGTATAGPSLLPAKVLATLNNVHLNVDLGAGGGTEATITSITPVVVGVKLLRFSLKPLSTYQAILKNYKPDPYGSGPVAVLDSRGKTNLTYQIEMAKSRTRGCVSASVGVAYSLSVPPAFVLCPSSLDETFAFHGGHMAVGDVTLSNTSIKKRVSFQTGNDLFVTDIRFQPAPNHNLVEFFYDNNSPPAVRQVNISAVAVERDFIYCQLTSYTSAKGNCPQ